MGQLNEEGEHTDMFARDGDQGVPGERAKAEVSDGIFEH